MSTLESGSFSFFVTVCRVGSKSGAVMTRLAFEVPSRLVSSNSLKPGFDPINTAPAPITAKNIRG